MKIGLTGASGSGKTTLLNALLPELRKRWPEMAEIKEVARRAMNRSVFKRGTWELQGFLHGCQSENELMNKSFISDRTMIDIAAHSTAYDDIFEKCEKHIKEHPYDHVFFVPVMHELEDDGVRTRNKAIQLIEQITIMAILKKWDIPYYFIAQDTVENRVSEILGKLGLIPHSTAL